MRRFGGTKADGNECVFFAPPEIHQILSDRKRSKGSDFILRKVIGNLEVAFTGNGQHREEENPRGDGYRALMEQSLKDAIDATRTVNSV
jgi:hypothetical protein